MMLSGVRRVACSMLYQTMQVTVLVLVRTEPSEGPIGRLLAESAGAFSISGSSPSAESRRASTQQSCRLLQPLCFGQLIPSLTLESPYYAVASVKSSSSRRLCHLHSFCSGLLFAMSVAAVLRRGPTRSSFLSSPACTRFSAFSKAQNVPR